VREQLRHADIQTTTAYTKLTQQDVRQALEMLNDEGEEKNDSNPSPRGTRLRGEKRHGITVVATTGFEPVFQSRPRLRWS
jgi:hypothetical protein